MRKVRHRNVCNIIEVLASTKEIFIVQELCPGGELFDEVIRQSRLREPVARKYFQQLISAIECCHLAGVAHRDLKPENLLLDEVPSPEGRADSAPRSCLA